jgi:hypothetical protein
MTAPVHTEPRAAAADSDAAAAAPGGMTMAFFLPSKYTSLEQLPRPNNPLVRLVEVPAKRYAVVTFSGLVGDEKVICASLAPALGCPTLIREGALAHVDLSMGSFSVSAFIFLVLSV